VRSSGGAGVTTIDATGLSASVVTCVNGEGPDTVLEGFTITGGIGTLSGAFFHGGGMYNVNSSPTVADCTFSGNTASFGGGMQNDDSSPTVTHCTFSNNNTTSLWGDGGGMYNSSSSPTVTNCTFSGNTATWGGGMDNRGDSSPTVINCILWGDMPGEIYNDPNSVPTVTYSDVQGGYVGTGNINADPLFADARGGDLRLGCLSPCVDAGNNAATGLAGVTLDLDGNPRFVDDAGVSDTGAGAPPIVDMGAYERQDNSGPGGATIYVPGDYGTIQDAIDDACPTDEIIVDPDTYYEAIDFKGKAITVRSSGGADVTTIDATGLSASVVKCVNGEGPDTVLDGFTITGGTGTDFGYGVRGGGGMYNSGADPMVIGCTFSGNSASNSGGGMYNSVSSPTVTQCTFSGNVAAYGGGMLNANSSSPAMTQCTFSGNTADYGGGMYNSESTPTVTHCTFSDNTTAFKGGGMHNEESSPTVIQCTFSGNTADYGGGMVNLQYSSPTVTECTFSGNTADYGGGMYNNINSSPTVTECTFSGNSAGLVGGGMANYGTGQPVVTNCLFSGNGSGQSGGAMINRDTSTATVTHCTFAGNLSTYGGGLDAGGVGTLVNCIFWGNTRSGGSSDETAQIRLGFEPPAIDYCCIQGLDTIGGTGNIGDDPVFMDADGPDDTFGTDDDNLRLAGGSPCVDAGDNAAISPGLTTDLDGNPRISHGMVDMGAYERQDDDGDGVTDEMDNCPDSSNADQQDTDGDEVGDACDDCPDTAAGDPVDADGCSTDDDDGDGVPNDADDCPDTLSCATNIDADGCPIDSDGDGVFDGCPVTPQVLDDDGDGVPNDEDACPNTPEGAAVDASGCPAGCCGASGPVAPLGLAVGLLLLSRFAGYRGVRRRR